MCRVGRSDVLSLPVPWEGSRPALRALIERRPGFVPFAVRVRG